MVQLFGHDKAEAVAGDGQRGGKPVARHAPGGLLEQALIAQELRELLGIALARQRPEPGAGAAAKQHGSDEGKVGFGH